MTVTAETLTLPDHPFIPEMVRQTRAFDSYGVNDGLTPAELLQPYVVTKEQRREIPVIGDPDEELIARLKAYYSAMAMRVEADCGKMASPMFSITHEGFGRVIISVGKLLVVDRSLRDVHRFGFESLEKMCSDADKIINSALALVEAHPDAAAA
ncbi:NifX-associated nitrogen fixation protein [Marinospirillum alkaliphilum]|uniref:Probable nitrogen fixation protein n=1 Tax=Marinospirillum alkaliphilum DSM 21637 TaxID=1122209 RepID=A0A1K1TKS5_9GAMM|nr:NifX-associated nitrogen fixation protein [Marinospirillum alkaliphilum]SFX01351.1 probable nitrogen fixation protein [Marinospirillum alkaliphilum DSM 21637]